MKLPIALSNRHVHLSQEDINILFGQGYELKKFFNTSGVKYRELGLKDENNLYPVTLDETYEIMVSKYGEEQGLLGSQYYVRKPILPLDKAEVINLDMVGSKEDVPLYISSYSDMKTELRNKLYVYSKDLELDIDIKLSNSASSDSTSFQQKDVDAITLIDHDWKSGYHSPKDTIELIDPSRIEKISKLILYYIDKTCY